MQRKYFVLALALAALGSVCLAFGLLVLIRGPHGAPLIPLGLVGVVCGLLAFAASFTVAAVGAEWLQNTPRVGRVNVDPVKSAERRRTALLTLLSSFGVSCFLLGALLVGTTFLTKVGLVAMLVGILLMICGIVLGASGGQIARPEAAASKSGEEKDASFDWRILGKVIGGTLALLMGVSMFVYIAWFQYSRRPKPDTVGYAEFKTEGYTLKFDLPANWRISYYSRSAPKFYQGRITDDHGQPRLRVYGGFRSEDLEEYRRRETKAYDKAKIPLEWSEYRETPGGRWWVHAVRLPEGDKFLGDSPVSVVTYSSSRGVHLEFTMPVAAAVELEPLTWRLVQSAEFGPATIGSYEKPSGRMVSVWLSVLIGVALLARILFGPYAVYVGLTFRLPATIVPLDSRLHPLPAEAQTYLDETRRDLTAEGFEFLVTAFVPDMVSNVKGLIALYANRATHDMAAAIIVAVRRGENDGSRLSDAPLDGLPLGAELKVRYVEFVRSYDDGILVQTNNSPELGAFKRMPGIFTIRFWQVRDIRRLYRLHQLLTERFCQGGSPVNRFDTEYGSDAVRYLCADLEGPLRDQVKAGYLTKGPEGLRPTIKGAAIMAWKELRPIKSIRRWREKRNAERLLADLEGK